MYKLSEEIECINVEYYALAGENQIVKGKCEINIKGSMKVGEIAEYIKQIIGAKTVVVTGVIR